MIVSQPRKEIDMVTKKAVRFPTLRHFGLRNVFDFSATTKQRKAIRKARVALKRKLAALARIYEGDQKPILREMAELQRICPHKAQYLAYSMGHPTDVICPDCGKNRD